MLAPLPLSLLLPSTPMRPSPYTPLNPVDLATTASVEAWTSRFAAGDAVPMPTLPAEFTVKAVTLVDSRMLPPVPEYNATSPPARAFEIEKCGLFGEPKPTQPVSAPALFQ